MIELRLYDAEGNQLDALYQWDVGQQITIKTTPLPGVQFHFCNRLSEFAYVCDPTAHEESPSASNPVVAYTCYVPDQLLQQPEAIIVYIYVEEQGSGSQYTGNHTVAFTHIPVIPRPRPADYVYNPNYSSGSDLSLVHADIAAIQSALDEIGSNNWVTTPRINNGAVTTLKIAEGAVDTDRLATGAVKTAKIDDLAVTNTKLGNGSVNAAKLANNSVTTIKINNSAVTTDKIAAGAVTSDKIGNSEVSEGNLRVNSVSTDKLQDGAVTANKIGAGEIANNKLQNMAPYTLKGNNTNSSGAPIDLVKNDVLSMFAMGGTGNSGVQRSGTSGFVPAPQPGDYNKFLRGDGQWATPGSTFQDMANMIDYAAQQGVDITFPTSLSTEDVRILLLPEGNFPVAGVDTLSDGDELSKAMTVINKLLTQIQNKLANNGDGSNIYSRREASYMFADIPYNTTLTFKQLLERLGSWYGVIDGKLDRDLGAANAGKLLCVGLDGNISLADPSTPQPINRFNLRPLLTRLNGYTTINGNGTLASTSGYEAYYCSVENLSDLRCELDSANTGYRNISFHTGIPQPGTYISGLNGNEDRKMVGYNYRYLFSNIEIPATATHIMFSYYSGVGSSSSQKIEGLYHNIVDYLLTKIASLESQLSN